MKSIFGVKISGLQIKAYCYRRNVTGTTQELKEKCAEMTRKTSVGTKFCLVDETQEAKFFERVDEIREQKKIAVLNTIKKLIHGYPHEFEANIYVYDQLKTMEESGIFFDAFQTYSFMENARMIAQNKK